MNSPLQPFDPKYFSDSGTKPLERETFKAENKIIVPEKKYGVSKPRKVIIRARVVNDKDN